MQSKWVELDSLFSFTPTVGSAVSSPRAPTLEKRASIGQNGVKMTTNYSY